MATSYRPLRLPSKGLYQHFKGGRYLVLGVWATLEAKDASSSTLVIYRREEDKDNPKARHWARPLDEFVEEVTWPSLERKPRFVPVEAP